MIQEKRKAGMRSPEQKWFRLSGSMSSWSLQWCSKSMVFVARKFFVSSFSAAVKFLPLSEMICCGVLLLATNRRSVLMKASADRSWHISRCTALDVRHVNMTPYRLLYCPRWFLKRKVQTSL